MPSIRSKGIISSTDDALVMRTLVIGLNEYTTKATKGKFFFSADTVKGFELIVINCSGLFSDSESNRIEIDQLEYLTNQLRSRINDLSEQISSGTVVVILPCPDWHSWQHNPMVHSPRMDDFVTMWNQLYFNIGRKVESGEHFEPLSEVFKSYMMELENIGVKFRHNVSLTLPKNFIPCLKIPNNKEIVAAASRIDKGLLIFLPGVKELPYGIDSYLNWLWELSQSLLESLPVTHAVEDLPAWTEEYLLPEEDLIRKLITEKIHQIDLKNRSLQELQERLRDRRELKRLIAGRGKDLENAVRQSMEFLEFTSASISDGTENRADGIFFDGERALVVEVKARENRGAIAKDISQLIRWKAEFYGQKERNPNALLLIVNGFQKNPLGQRDNSKIYADNIVQDATQNGFGLLSGLQLLCIQVAVEKGELSKEKARNILFECVGLLEGYDSL